MDRRKFLKLTFFGAALVSVFPKDMFAHWNDPAFKADSFEKALQALYGKQTLISSEQVLLDIPDTATNSATVPVRISCTLKKVESMAFFVEKNKSPLTLQFNLKPKMLPYISTRVKIKESCTVYAVVAAEGKLYSASRFVKVTSEAC
jgi:sulfur-oxidizing protein SoxY